MSVGTTGPRGRCDVEVPGPATGPCGEGATGSVSPDGVIAGAFLRPVPRPAGRPLPAGTRPSRPEDSRGPVRPAGRRGPTVLPPVRPRVAGGGAGSPWPHREPAGVAGGAPAVPAVVRRRRVAALVVLGVVLGALVGVLLGLVVPSGVPAGAPPAGTTVAVVGSGESLSDVAGRVAPGADTGAVVARIRELNGLDGSSVAAGRPLVVPAAG